MNEDNIKFLTDETYSEYVKLFSDLEYKIRNMKNNLNDIKKQISNLVDAISKGAYNQSIQEKLDKLEMEKERQTTLLYS